MARPQKSGLDYFALDVQMDDAVNIIEAEHGLAGFAIIIKLFQRIYNEGYYYKWTEKEQILFSSRVSTDRNLVTTIVEDCIKWGIFNQELYENHTILTSRRIQNHYSTATYKRVNVEMVKEYLLIDVSDRKNINVIRVSDDGNPATTKDTDDKSTQSKVKESKVKKNTKPSRPTDEKKGKKDESKDDKPKPLTEQRFDEFWALYPKKVGKKVAFTSWKKAKVNKELHEKIIKAVTMAKNTEQWQRENGRFIPNPSTWLNQGRWDDEYEEVGHGTNSQHNKSPNGEKATPGQQQGGGNGLSGFKTADEDDFYTRG